MVPLYIYWTGGEAKGNVIPLANGHGINRYLLIVYSRVATNVVTAVPMVAGNWDDSGNNGGFTPSAATVTLSGTGTTVTAGTNNNFFNFYYMLQF